MVFFIFIFFVLLLIYCLIIDYYRRRWKQIPEYIAADGIAPEVKISVIVAVRNEENNVPRLAQNFSQQSYPTNLVQYIFINDHSTDETLARLNEAFSSFNNVMILSLPDNVEGKKHAIAYGIQHATGELIVTTDADCVVQPDWLYILSSFYLETGAKFIAAPVKMISRNNLLGIFQRLDFMTMQGITGASVHNKLHMMCNGANLAYSRTAFHEVNGFEGIDHIPSGDDMLLMYKIFERYPSQVFYLKSIAAIVETPAESSLTNFFNQRIRWASKAVHYRDKKIFYVLLLTWLVNAGFVVLTTLCLLNYRLWWLLLLMFCIKVLVEFPFVNSIAALFNERRLLKFFPLLQPLHIIYIVVSGWFGRFGTYEWKTRKIKNKGAVTPSKL